MARPKKNQGDPAEQRIKDAFWTLLNDNDLKDITVSMITAQAKCNRGTFYYHYDSLEKLLDNVIADELMIKSSVPRALFYLICKKTNPFELDNYALHIRRFGMMMARAGQEGIDTKVKAAVVNTWESLLCKEGDRLTLETRLVIEYTISGLIGLISYLYREGLLDDSKPLPDETLLSLKENSQYLVANISRAQNLTLEEVEERICLQMRSPQNEACRSCPNAASLL